MSVDYSSPNFDVHQSNNIPEYEAESSSPKDVFNALVANVAVEAVRSSESTEQMAELVEDRERIMNMLYGNLPEEHEGEVENLVEAFYVPMMQAVQIAYIKGIKMGMHMESFSGI